ncbi:hypothetical protein [Roseateles puraquae]|uniref:Uncharacterized protein n=1 Tax=Roseateles puraquae TaxID=431059 RepID=A0A254NAJ2_9BURK|nr:hypothetical protein [Roseateles puraquae]MDG0855341.1 hypothetical protein [Roseateles puraquae]OWR03407.1 hypothetical protein CDO81_12965 [Roseateles puraquae]
MQNRPYIDPTSAAAEALGPKPPAEPPAAWQQASNRPRPKPGRVAPRPVVKSSHGYFKAHWLGEHSLPRSYWLNNFLVATPLAMALTGLMSWISVKGDSLQISAIVVLIGFPLLIALNVWCLVGAWRSARNYLQERGSALWGWLARISLVLGTAQLAASVLFGFLPSLGEYAQMARGIDPIGQAKFTLSPDGRSLRLEGVIGMGDGERLRSLLASEAAQGLKRVELVSPGGRVREAERMAEALKARHQGARAVGTCASACTLVFLAGSPRHLSPEGQLGFHRASTGTYNPVFEELANQELAKTYRRLGLPESMIDKTLNTPSRSMWYVPREELQRYELIAPSPRTLAIALPAAGAPLPDYEDALRVHPVWAALDKRTPGLIDTLAQRMVAARAAGGDDDTVQATVWSPLATQMPGIIQGTDGVLRRRYVQLVSDQLKTLRTPAQPGTRPGCRDLLDGRVAVRGQLPLELQAREASWLLDVANSAPPRWLPKPPTPIEVEVLDRSVGSAAMGMLSRLWVDAPDAPAAAAGASCDPVIALLDRLPKQTPARRELADRLLFHAR